jgi:hypothetical protein
MDIAVHIPLMATLVPLSMGCAELSEGAEHTSFGSGGDVSGFVPIHLATFETELSTC